MTAVNDNDMTSSTTTMVLEARAAAAVTQYDYPITFNFPIMFM